ncbi:hypothetical protein Dimus_010246 [Dionaea muscipula]
MGAGQGVYLATAMQGLIEKEGTRQDCPRFMVGNRERQNGLLLSYEDHVGEELEITDVDVAPELTFWQEADGDIKRSGRFLNKLLGGSFVASVGRKVTMWQCARAWWEDGGTNGKLKDPRETKAMSKGILLAKGDKRRMHLG